MSNLTSEDIVTIFGPMTLYDSWAVENNTRMARLIQELTPAHPEIERIANCCCHAATSKLVMAMGERIQPPFSAVIIEKDVFDTLFCGPYIGRFHALLGQESFRPKEAVHWYTMILIVACTDPDFRDDMRACLCSARAIG